MEENGGKPSPEAEAEVRWQFGPNKSVEAAGSRSIRGTLNKVIASVEETGPRPIIPLGHGDPSVFPSFRTTPIAEDAIVEAVRSAKYNSYFPTNGVLPARRAVAEYLSKDLPYKLSPDDVFLTAGCAQAIEIVITALARPDANILLPRPGFPMYEACCTFNHLEMRHFDLIPEKGWEVDLDQVEKLAMRILLPLFFSILIILAAVCLSISTWRSLLIPSDAIWTSQRILLPLYREQYLKL